MSQEQLKIAVCFFGHLRSYKRCAAFLRRNFLEYHDCDLFMHTWSKLDHNTQTWHNSKKIDGITRCEDIIHAYGNLKSIAIEEQKPEDLGVIKLSTNISIFGLNAMFYSMRESLRQCEAYAAQNKVKYDYILFIRPDIWLKKPLKLAKILELYSPIEISRRFFTLVGYTPSITAGFEDVGGVDLCFFATPKTMSDIIRNNASATEDFKPNMKINHCPEYNFIKLVEKRGFMPCRIEEFRIPKDWDILRSNKSVKLLSRMIRLRIRWNGFRLWLFPTMTYRVFNTKIDLLGIFKINLAIGDPWQEVNHI